MLSTSQAVPIPGRRQSQDSNDENNTLVESGLHSAITSRSVPGTDRYLRAPPPISPIRGTNRRSSYSTPYRNHPLSLSPLVGNYFGFHRQRDSERPTSSTIDEQPEKNDEESEGLGLWGHSESESKSGIFNVTYDEAEEESEDDDDDAIDDLLDDDDGEDEGDSIELFEHR